MKKHASTILLLVILLLGLSLMLYPSFADWWNSFHQSQAVLSYVEQVADMDEDRYAQIWDAAWSYNRMLTERPNDYLLSEEQKENYESLLNLGGNGVMGYLEIPCLDVVLPVHHGTSESVLQVAVGHLEWTSLPVGGESTHCVVSGHRGLPSARLFTDLDKMVVGDYFVLRVLDEILTYEVDQIRIVDPHDTTDLLVVEGEDLCTLVTCTPYGINSHRLLVRGRRIANIEEAKVARVTADAIQIKPLLVAPAVAAPILLILLVGMLLPRRKKNR